MSNQYTQSATTSIELHRQSIVEGQDPLRAARQCTQVSLTQATLFFGAAGVVQQPHESSPRDSVMSMFSRRSTRSLEDQLNLCSSTGSLGRYRTRPTLPSMFYSRDWMCYRCRTRSRYLSILMTRPNHLWQGEPPVQGLPTSCDEEPVAA
jgi:hypothetical protein